MEQAADPDWVLLELEPAKAARAGLPDRIAAPRAEAEAGIDVERPLAARWGAAFAAAQLAPTPARAGLPRPAESLLAIETALTSLRLRYCCGGLWEGERVKQIVQCWTIRRHVRFFLVVIGLGKLSRVRLVIGFRFQFLLMNLIRET